MLIGNDIADPEGFLIDVSKRKVTIRSCKDMVCPLRITPRGKPVEHRMVRTKHEMVLKRHYTTIIPVVSKKLPDDRDYRFVAHYNPNTAHLAVHGTFPEAILDANSMFVTYYNNSKTDLLLPANSNIGELSEWDSDERATKEDPNVIDCLFTTASIIPNLKFAMTTRLTALAGAQAIFSKGDSYKPSSTTLLTADQPTCFPTASVSICSLLPPLNEPGDETSKFGPDAVNINTTDDIDSDQIKGLRDVVAEFPKLWEDRIDRIIEPEEEWMQIPLKEGAVLESKGRYRVSKRDEAIIDEFFDKARADGRMSAAEEVIPVGWPVFVVWKNGKPRPVVDLRGLNANTVKDAYPLPLQEEVMNCVDGCYYIALFNLQKMFWQAYLDRKDRWKTTTITHRGQEWFNMVPTGACGSPSHMQRKMDKKLKKHKIYARCYIDDVVVFLRTYAEHIQHIRAVLTTLSEMGCTLSPDKCYLGYHSVKLLGHVVNRFGLSTQEDKVEAIANMRFPKYLHELELFIGLSGYYRHFIARYAAIIEPLQNLKTKLLKGAERKNK